MTFKNIIGSLNPERVKSIRIITLCILAAATFWFLNSLNHSYSTTLKYPIKFIYDEERYMAVSALPDEIQLNVNGVGWNLFRNNIGLSDAPVQIPLENTSETKKIVASSLIGIISEQLTEFQVNFIITDTLYVDLDLKIEKSFSLFIDSASIDVDESHWITDGISFSPDSVKLMGPKRFLENMPDTILISVPDENIDDDYNEDLPIQIANSQLISRDPPTINVQFDIEEYDEIKLFTKIQTLNFPNDSSSYLATNQTNVTYEISKSEAEAINDSSFQVIADFKEFRASDSLIELKLIKVPAEVRNVKIDSTLVKVIFNEY